MRCIYSDQFICSPFLAFWNKYGMDREAGLAEKIIVSVSGLPYYIYKEKL